MLDTEKLSQFIALARLGSYTGAAAALHISQPTLTRTVQSLERTLHAKLVDRGRSGVSLTAVGVELLHHAEELLQHANNIEEDIAQHARGIRGHVRFGYGPIVGSVILPGVARRIARDGLNITIGTVVTQAQTMHDMLLAGDLDFFISREPLPGWSDRIRAQTIGHMRLEFFVRDGHPLTERSSVAFSDIGDFPRVCGSAWNDLLPLVAASEIQQFTRATIETDDSAAPHTLARDIDAVIVLHAGVDHHGLTQLDITDRRDNFPPRDVVLNTPAQRSMSPAVQHVLREVMDVASTVYGPRPSPGSGAG